jgi:hypothetical protein
MEIGWAAIFFMGPTALIYLLERILLGLPLGAPLSQAKNRRQVHEEG